MILKALPLTTTPGGLLSVSHTKRSTSPTPEWSNGSFSWHTDRCPTSVDIYDLCSGGDYGEIASAVSSGQGGWPFGITTTYECLTAGYTLAERRTTAKKQLEAVTEKALERELQRGEAVISGGHYDFHYLADADAVDLSGAAVSIGQGIAALEQGLADCGLGTQGVIHLSTSVGSLAASEKIIERKGDEFFTRLGTPVVIGTGYDPAATQAAGAPTSPTKPALVVPKPLPSTQLIYASGSIGVLLGPIEILEEITDIKKNNIKTMAARPAALYMDSCCHFVVEVKTHDVSVIGLP